MRDIKLVAVSRAGQKAYFPVYVSLPSFTHAFLTQCDSSF